MARKTRKFKGGKGKRFSLFTKKRTTPRRSSSIKRSVERRKKILEKINKEKGIDALKKNKCLIQYKNCMNVSRRKSI
jgi:hypothetical protein